MGQGRTTKQKKRKIKMEMVMGFQFPFPIRLAASLTCTSDKTFPAFAVTQIIFYNMKLKLFYFV